jgi:phosphinothricin acetyltransferase
MLRPVQPGDAASIAGIYNYYIRATTVSFEEAEVTSEEMQRRIKTYTGDDVEGRPYPWFVYTEDDEVIGYAYIHKFHERAAYRYTGEPSIYLKQGYGRQGRGMQLMQALLEAGRAMKLHALVSLVTLPNPASEALHKKAGFELVGRLRQAGFKLGQWLDVGYYEYLL